MENFMHDFINFIHKDELAKAKSEEEKLNIHKKHKLYQEPNDFYDEEEDEDDIEEMSEAIRVPAKKPIRREYRNEQPMEYQEPKYCVPKPSRRDYIETENELNQYGKRLHKTKHTLDFDPGFNESKQSKEKSVLNNPVLNEAYKMIDEMKEKIESMFYKYGMVGLKRLNECMVDVFTDVLNPKIDIVEKEERIPQVIKKKKIIKKPILKPEVNNIEEKIKKIDTEEEMDLIENENQSFEMNNNIDLENIGSCLTEVNNLQKNKETETIKKIKSINNKARKLQESINNSKNKEDIEKPEENTFIQSDENEIIENDEIINNTVDEENEEEK